MEGTAVEEKIPVICFSFARNVFIFFSLSLITHVHDRISLSFFLSHTAEHTAEHIGEHTGEWRLAEHKKREAGKNP